MKLAKFFNYDFDNGYFRLYDKNSNVIYHENENGVWWKREFDIDNNVIYHESSLDGVIFDQREIPELIYEFVFFDGRSAMCSGNLELEVIVNNGSCFHDIETLLKPCDVSVGDRIVCVGDKEIKYILTSKKK